METNVYVEFLDIERDKGKARARARDLWEKAFPDREFPGIETFQEGGILFSWPKGAGDAQAGAFALFLYFARDRERIFSITIS